MREDERTEPRVAAASFKAARKFPSIRLKTILTTTDFSAASMYGVRLANWLAGRFSASVLLAHVVEPPSRFSGMDQVILAREDHEVLKSAEKQLNRLVNRELESKATMLTCVRKGKAFHEITKLAHERDIDLIVIATRGHTGLTLALLGSTAERVVRHAPCPVLTVPARKAVARGKEVSRLRLKRIVVPIDGSATSLEALPYATAFADEFGAQITLLHVVEPFMSPHEHIRGKAPGCNDKGATATWLARLSQERLASVRRVRTAVRHGVPFQEITRVATRFGSGLILLTTHGYTGLKHVLLGSTAERVVRHADCPVLVFRNKTSVGRGYRGQ